MNILRVLLDTHIFLWFISGDKRLPEYVKESIRNPNNEVYLSVVSVWEAIIKQQLGLYLCQSRPNYICLPSVNGI